MRPVPPALALAACARLSRLRGPGPLRSRSLARYWIVMGTDDDHVLPDGSSDLPDVVVVEVAVLGDPDSRSWAGRIAGNRGAVCRRAIAGLILVLAVATTGALGLDNRSASRSRMDGVAGDPGPIGMAVRDAFSPDCLRFTTVTIRTAGRANVTYHTRCARYTRRRP